jgi:hypothetical protein
MDLTGSCGSFCFALNDRKFNPAAIPPRQAETPEAGADEVADCA